MSEVMHSTENSRSAGWRSVNVKTYAVIEDGTSIDVTLVKLCTKGCWMRAVTKLEPGMKISLSLLRHGSIDAQVRTVSKDQIELVFNVDPTLIRTQRVRQSDRIPVSGEVLLRRRLRNSYQVHIFDISIHGCRLEFVDRPKVNEQVYVGFPGFRSLPAEVRWIGPAWIGLSFQKPLHPAVFDTLVTRLHGVKVAANCDRTVGFSNASAAVPS